MKIDKHFKAVGIEPGMTFDEIAKRLGISNARCQQLCTRAIRKMQIGLRAIAAEYFETKS